jgi:primosomal protein N' (replication factor Y)
MKYYEIAISGSPLLKKYTYAAHSGIKAGSRVLVDFHNRKVVGYIVNEIDSSLVNITKIKDISDIIDYNPIISSAHVRLAEKTARYYYSPIGKIFDLFFSASPKISVQVRVLRHSFDSMPGFKESEASVLLKEFFSRTGEKKGKALLNEWLEEKKVEVVTGMKSKEIKPRTDYWVKIARNLPYILNSESKEKTKTWGILQYLLLHSEEKASFIKKTYNVSDTFLKSLEVKGFIITETLQPEDMEYSDTRRAVSLTKKQNAIVDAILQASYNAQPILEHLFYGVTGSGKTEVYFSLISEVLRQQRSVLFLIPEISLSPQTISRVKARFPEIAVGIYHSGLKLPQRQKEWRKAIEGETRILLGTRSSLWLPLRELGMIIMDEEHDESYLQDDTQPHYDVKTVVRWISELWGIPVVYGSATPRIESFFEADVLKRVQLHILSERPKGIALPEVHIIDISHSERITPFFSKELVQRIDAVLREDKQVFLLANRKGFAPFLICSNCGFVAKCPECDVSLTFHRARGVLKCHYCGYQNPLLRKCPNCQGEALTFSGYGTEKVEEALLTLFPDKRILRIDRENVDSVEKLNKAFQIIAEHKTDIVIGTKMISKGLDFPNVSLVGILDADHFLYFPDFRAAERTYQLLSQMSGRAGRALSGSTVIIQTRSKEKKAVQLSATHDYLRFYESELLNRKLAGYPPYSQIILLNFSCYDKVLGSDIAAKCSETLKKSLKSEHTLLGPTEALIPRIAGNYRYKSIIKTTRVDDCVRVIEEVLMHHPEYEKYVTVLVDPIGMIL